MPNIVQRIVLEGGAAVVTALQAIGTAGQRSLQQIQQAANAINFDRMNTQLRTVGTNLKTLGGEFSAVAGRLGAVFGVTITAGAGAFALSLLEVARAGAEAADAVDDLASDIGSTIDEVQALQSVFITTGVNIEGLEEKFRRLAVNTQKIWADIRDAVRDASDVIKRDQLGIAEAAVGVSQAQLNLQKAFAAYTNAAEDTASKEQALLNLRSARLSVDRALLQQSEARKKSIDDEANSVANLAGHIQAVTRGEQGFANVNLTAENALKGIIATAGQGTGALQKIEGNFYDIASRAGPQLNSVFNVMAGYFQNLKDEALKTAIATAAFGRSVSHDMIEALSKGPAAFAQARAELQRLGLSFDEADTKVANTFKESYNKLLSYISLIKARIGLEIAPAASQLVRIITQALTDNIGKIRNWAQSIADFIRNTLTPAVQAFVNVMNGVSFDQWIKSADAIGLTLDQILSVKKWSERFEAIKQGFTDAVAVIKVVLLSLIGVLDLVAGAINKVFGTNLSGEGLGIALLILQFTGLLRVIGLVAQAVIGLGQLIFTFGTVAIQFLAPFLGWPALAIAAFAALVIAIYTYWDEIKAATAAVVAALVSAWNELVLEVGELIDWLKNKFNAFVDSVLSGAAKIGKFLKGVFGGGEGAGATGSYAGGGEIHGPGTGTSDSIIARVSSGEYVVRAAAVKHWGTGFMHAINSAPAFALGGLVDSLSSALAPLAMPRLAEGGAVPDRGGGLRPFTLVMPNGASYGGLYAEGGTVTQLRRAAVHAQVSSTGRRPSWVR